MRILRNKGFQNIKADTIYSNGISFEENYEDFKEYPGDNTKLVLSKSLNNEQTADLEIYKIEDNSISNKYSYFINNIQSDNPESQYYFSKNSEELTFELIKENGLLSVLIDKVESYGVLKLTPITTEDKEIYLFSNNGLRIENFNNSNGGFNFTSNDITIDDPFQKYINNPFSKISFEITDKNNIKWYLEFETLEYNLPSGSIIFFKDYLKRIKNFGETNQIVDPPDYPVYNDILFQFQLEDLKIYGGNSGDFSGKLTYLS